MPATNEYSFFDSVTKSFDKAAQFTKWDPGILEQIKECKPGPTSDLYKSPKALFVFLTQVLLGDRAEKSKIESDRKGKTLALERELADPVLAPVL